MMKIEPVVLEGQHVRLEPLTREHTTPIIEVGMEPDIWRWTNNVVNSEADIERYLNDAFAMRDAGILISHTVRSRSAGRG